MKSLFLAIHLIFFNYQLTDVVANAEQLYQQEPVNVEQSNYPLKSEEKKYENKAIVLMYHMIQENPPKGSISPQEFERHIQFLIDNDYNIIDMHQFINFKENNQPIPKNSVVITFDDGYESFYTYAFPILKKYHVTATNFLIVKSTEIFNPKINKHLTWEQIEEMKSYGMTFYNHTYDLHYYATVNQEGKTDSALANKLYLNQEKRMETDDEYNKRIETDLLKAEELLHKHIPNNESILAFPYGRYSNQLIDISKKMNINLFFTTVKGINSRQGNLIYRVNAGWNNIKGEDLIATLKRFNDK